MKLMIHACPERLWYVEGFLIPSIVEQGMDRDSIDIWNDVNRDGNLYSCVKSFGYVGEKEGGTWHLQDDVVIARDFYLRAKENDEGIVCGFCGEKIGPDPEKVGIVRPKNMWFSFPCIRIPNYLAAEFAEWFYLDASKREFFRERVEKRKSDDFFWLNFLKEMHPLMTLKNLKPNLVDHVDFLLGGSTINQIRTRSSRAVYFNDESLIKELEQKILMRGVLNEQ